MHSLTRLIRRGGLAFMTAGLSVVGWHALVAGAVAPTVTITTSAGAPTSGGYADGQVVSVSVGPNSDFVPNTRVNIIECADPGGVAANLPTSDLTCDGNTIQGDSILVQGNGSFSEKTFTMYRLPNSVLGEQSNSQPVCDASHLCVLYVGEDQNDFTRPKVFSAPFGVAVGVSQSPGTSAGSGASTGGAGGSAGTSPPTSAPAAAGSASVGSSASVPSSSDNSVSTSAMGTLAFTGVRPLFLWLVSLGGSFVLMGEVLRRLVGRRAPSIAPSNVVSPGEWGRFR